MQSLTPTPTRDVTLEEALTCFCGDGWDRHEERKVALDANGSQPVNVLYCRAHRRLCLAPEVRDRLQEASGRRAHRNLPWERFRKKRAQRRRYQHRREMGYSARCVQDKHDRCNGVRWLSNHDHTESPCHCPCHGEEESKP